MILSDATISALLERQILRIAPLEEGQIQPASVDIRLGNTFAVVRDSPSGVLTMENEIEYHTIRADSYLLLPGQFVLATTMEFVALPDDLTAFVEGRSSLGRMGLFIQNAGWVDPGFQGEITLELYNANRFAIELKAGRRIGQLVFAKMDRAARNPYRGKYQGQTGATGSRVFLDRQRPLAPKRVPRIWLETKWPCRPRSKVDGPWLSWRSSWPPSPWKEKERACREPPSGSK